MSSLSAKLRRSKCDINDKKFVSLDIIESVITEQSIRDTLESTEGWISGLINRFYPSDVPRRVAEKAKKVFATLVLMGKATAIYELLEDGLTDDHLPLHRGAVYDNVLSCDSQREFAISGWPDHLLDTFIDDKQSLFLAPVLPSDGQLVKLDERCALPFIESDVMTTGGTGTVYWARLLEKHQKGYEANTVNLEVAVKRFHHRKTLFQPDKASNDDAFTKEHKILEKIKDLPHRHIIRHFVSIDQCNDGYIIFPWADGGDLQHHWEASKEHGSREQALWSMRQMAGLAMALDSLHETLNCRHGDLKPLNILCFTESGHTVLKIADFGIARIHDNRTGLRKGATTTLGLTLSYQGPEVEFERANRDEQLPRSRKYDIWSLGCIFLEFSIWLLYGAKSIEEFTRTRGVIPSSTESSVPLYEITDKAAKAARVHQLVSWTIDGILGNDPRCKKDTALGTLLYLIKDQMLQPEVDKSPSARTIGEQLEMIVQEAETPKSKGYLFRSEDKLTIPPLNFDHFRWT